MDRQEIHTPWGSEDMNLSIPGNWKIKGILEPSSIPAVLNPAQEVERALADPIGTDKLDKMGEGKKQITIVIDDISRPTPVSTIFPLVLKELIKSGAERKNITIVTALGVHRGMDEQEILQRTGLSAFEGLNWENHDSDDMDKMSFLGTTSRGTPVWFNKHVAEADLVVSIGCIEPHIIASFGGGYKNLLPGVAGKLSIAHNHALNCKPGTFNMVGQPIENNPMRQDLEEAGRMVKGQIFIVNAILNNAQQVVRVVCGDPIKAHRAGVQVSAGLYGVKIPGKADIVITDSHPMDSDLRQGVKALANTVRALKPGGVMITLVRAEEGVGVFGLANKKLPIGRNALKILAPAILPLITKIKLKGMGEEDKFFLYFALQAMRMGTLLIYGPTIPEKIHPNLPFVTFIKSIEESIQFASNRKPNHPEVLIFPNGGITYPII
jgi:lactate racemase